MLSGNNSFWKEKVMFIETCGRAESPKNVKNIAKIFQKKFVMHSEQMKKCIC